ncbi:unnamed protein product [Absidia cylindrospora]
MSAELLLEKLFELQQQQQKQLNEVRQQLQLWMAPAATGREEVSTNTADGEVIPWPRYQMQSKEKRLPFSKIMKQHVLEAIEEQVLQRAEKTPHRYTTANKTFQVNMIYQRLRQAIKDLASDENLGRNVASYADVSLKTKVALTLRLEAKANRLKLFLDKAEDSWMARYFVLCYFNNKFAQMARQKVKESKIQTRRRSARVSASKNQNSHI